MQTRRIIILGSTGSIGRQTIEVIAHLNALADKGEFPHRFDIVGLCAGKDHDALFAQAAALNIRDIALASDNHPDAAMLARSRSINLRRGKSAAEQLVREVECDLVLAAIVGSAGLPATLAAVELGRDVALANKETLVAAGDIVVQAAQRTGARLLPVDSEHSGIWQCLIGHPGDCPNPPSHFLTPTHPLISTSDIRHPTSDIPHPPLAPPLSLTNIRRIILTASGGALRNRSREDTYNATPEEALAHPTWSMGAKVTIDSASLTNKALELIEAHWLFGLPSSCLEALIHPQSIIHSLVEFHDGSTIAQLGSPDMRTPIQYALTFPHHIAGRAPSIDWTSLARLDLSPPDPERFPALALGHRVIDLGGTAGALFNAANEAAVEAFLARRIPFGRIPELSAAAIDEVGVSPVRTLDDIHAADRAARAYVASSIRALPAHH